MKFRFTILLMIALFLMFTNCNNTKDQLYLLSTDGTRIIANNLVQLYD